MPKNFYTLIIVPNSSSGLHKLRIPLWAVYACSVLGILVFFSAVGLSFNYARMALRTADHEQLLSENTTLQVDNKNLEMSTRQLYVKLQRLEDQAEQIQDMMQADTWNQRLGLTESIGVGGSLDNYPTGTMIASLNTLDNLDLARDRALELEDQLQFVESLVLTRNGKLDLTPSIWPVIGPTRSGFGRRRDPFTGEPEFHQGLDIGALYGSVVRAPANGHVVFAARRSAYGNLIVLDHGGGITTRYGHLSHLDVGVGDQLRKGDPIGYVGSSGRSTGPHLHYEVRSNDRAVNPRNYLPTNPGRTAD